ncbi:DNA-methyltransferase [Microbacterium sp. 22303]|uniref:DNA-methyltransferase n=1 Tax=Microbacterium sp. 22303 TaxID=3453905 RepID=UPI003F850BD0
MPHPAIPPTPPAAAPPTPIHVDDRVTLYLGDTVSMLPQLPAASVDALISDPPYGLSFNGHTWDDASGFLESLQHLDTRNMTPPEIFETWCTEWARGALHVLKPGAHAAVFGGTRTWHRMVRGLENAGFEVRDQIAWLYSSGMPKSMDVSYALDRRNGAIRSDRIVQKADHPSVLGATRRVVSAGLPVSDDAQQWQGWGTALRPAFEPIMLARKPVAGTVVGSVLEHGTGALNIDAARFDENRWPPNVALDPTQADALDLLTGSWRTQPASTTFPVFRYEAKPNREERPRAFGVSHATVKPLALMRWLIRLITPPGGLILEPFAGSGTTVEAGVLERFRVVAIEKEPEFVPLIISRLDRSTS